jgi:hypothetical protein
MRDRAEQAVRRGLERQVFNDRDFAGFPFTSAPILRRSSNPPILSLQRTDSQMFGKYVGGLVKLEKPKGIQRL